MPAYADDVQFFTITEASKFDHVLVVVTGGNFVQSFGTKGFEVPAGWSVSNEVLHSETLSDVSGVTSLTFGIDSTTTGLLPNLRYEFQPYNGKCPLCPIKNAVGPLISVVKQDPAPFTAQAGASNVSIIPEPGTVMLTGCGLLGVGLLTKRRKVVASRTA